MVRPHPGAATPPTVAFANRLLVVGSALGLDFPRGYGWIWFGVLVGFSILS